jgi:hypothetical protein
LGVVGYIATKDWVFLLLPIAFAGTLWGIKGLPDSYLMIWMTIPFAIEIDLPGGFSTDFPAETLMWASCFFLPVYLFLNRGEVSFRFIFEPLFILLFIHFSWIIVTTITSEDPIISIKYTLAKAWYLVCFIVIPLILFRRAEDYKQWGFFLFIPLLSFHHCGVDPSTVNMVLPFRRSTMLSFPSTVIMLIMHVVLVCCCPLPGG